MGSDRWDGQLRFVQLPAQIPPPGTVQALRVEARVWPGNQLDPGVACAAHDVDLCLYR
jgi:hypothetical protein